MIVVGAYNTLSVQSMAPEGALLSDGRNSVLLPARHAPPNLRAGEELSVFVFTDSEDVLTATTESPRAIVGEFACLEVVHVTAHGAFLNWGLDKDLFAPNNQQFEPLRVGERHVVAVYLDARTERVAAASRLSGYFDYDLSSLEPGQAVDLLVYGFGELGVQVVVNRRYHGLIYKSEIFQRLSVGDELKGYIQLIRADNKLDISLKRRGAEAAADAVEVLLKALKEAGGSLPLHDRCAPSEIYAQLGISKKAFKSAVGRLYRARRLAFDEQRVWLTQPDGRS